MRSILGTVLAVTVCALLMVILGGCGGGGDTVASPQVTATGLRVVTDDGTGTYAVYGGNYVPGSGGLMWDEQVVDPRVMAAINRDPGAYGYRLLGEATGTAEFPGGPYNYYLIRPAGNGTVHVDALQLMGTNQCWTGWSSRESGVGPFYSVNVDDVNELWGLPDGRAASILHQSGAGTAGQGGTDGFIMLPGHSWVSSQRAG